MEETCRHRGHSVAFGTKRETSRSIGFPPLVPVPTPSISSTDLGHPGKADNVGCFDATPRSFVLRGQNKVRDPVWSSGPKCRCCRCLLWGWRRSGAGEMRQGRRARRTRVAEVNLNLVDPPPPILVRSNYPLETWSAKAGRVPSREPEIVPQQGYSHSSHFSPAQSSVPLLPLSPLAPANLLARDRHRRRRRG